MAPVGSPDPTPCSRPDLAARMFALEELRPAELAALRAHAAACPACGPALGLITRAERWLSAQAPRQAEDACPSAAELYDVAKAPGASPLAPERARVLEAHVERCAECGSLLATLASRPPAPLILDPLPDGYGGPLDLLARQPADHPLPTRRPSLVRRLTPLAAAAAIVFALLFWRSGKLTGPFVAGAPGVVYPEAPLLRGDQGGALLFPRGAVLADASGELVHGLLFELAPPERAESLRVRVESRPDSPLGRGLRVLSLEGSTPLLQAEDLAPGAYTWEAWAVVDGLEVPLGRRDFEVRSDADTCAELERLAATPEPRRSTAVLELLTERGYASDARAWARDLPPSSARDAFLARTPGR